jgi:hypothetical protein
MPFYGSKGKGKTGARAGYTSRPNPGKRIRESDEALSTYDSASQAVAKFLRGPPLSNCVDGPSPNVRRRLDPDISSFARAAALESDSSTFSAASGPCIEDISLRQSLESTVAASPSIPGDSNTSYYESRRADPFGYVSNDRTTLHSMPQIPSLQSGFDRHLSSHELNVSVDSTLPLQVVPLREIEPMHSHAYVTFGAGMKQKQIDIFTAKNPLDAKSPGNEKIAYHVPL